MMEVLVALVILGIVATIFAQTSRISQRMSGRAQNWDQEGVAIESVLENLRVDYTLPRLRNLDSSWTENKGQYKLTMRVVGSTPEASDCPGYPVTRLAKVSVSAQRSDLRDSLQVTTFILVP